MKIGSEQEMLDFGKSFAKKVRFPMIIELIGDVGTGKTTFTRGLAEGLGVKKPVTSPSFTISKAYALPGDKRLIHYDFYRLNDAGLMANNLEEAINDNSIVVIEWGKSVKNILPEDRTIISIKLQNDGTRKVTIKDNRNSIFRDISRPTGSELARSPVTTGATKRVEKGTIRLSSSTSSPENTIRLFLDTSTPETILKIDDKEYKHVFANDLAEKLLKFIEDKLKEDDKTWQDITEIEFMSGPGSFTGLRIGASIVNTLAHELNIPLYDHHHKKQKIIIPEYGRPANISKPVK